MRQREAPHSLKQTKCYAVGPPTPVKHPSPVMRPIIELMKLALPHTAPAMISEAPDLDREGGEGR